MSADSTSHIQVIYLSRMSQINLIDILHTSDTYTCGTHLNCVFIKSLKTIRERVCFANLRNLRGIYTDHTPKVTALQSGPKVTRVLTGPRSDPKRQSYTQRK